MKYALILVPIIACVLAAGPSHAPSANELIEAGNAALLRGDAVTAEKQFVAALERTDDPGLVAFNLGILHFQRKEYTEAERFFTRSLDDADAPADRRAKALYNRGVCLLHRGGIAQFRTAIDSFERCLKATEAEELRSDAQQNLELAKLLWAEARVNAKEKPKPNEPSPNAPPDPKKPESSDDPQNPEPNGGEPKVGTPSKIDPLTGQAIPKQKPKETEKTVGGKGNLPVRIDPETWRPKSEDKAREFLKVLSQRLAKDRRNSVEVHATPERADVKDW